MLSAVQSPRPSLGRVQPAPVPSTTLPRQLCGDAAASVRAIAASAGLWRAGLIADLEMQDLDIPVIVLLWRLLRPINENLALMATALNLSAEEIRGHGRPGPSSQGACC